MSESRQTVRHVAALAVQRVVLTAAGFLFAAVIPRVMGPEVFGQFSTLLASSLWFSLLSGFGAVSLMTRFVPELMGRGDREGVRKLASNLLTLRAASGVASAVAYQLLVRQWLVDLPVWAIGLAGMAITARTLANLPFTLFLGLNEAARWGAADVGRRLLLFPLVYGGFVVGGLTGACGGLFATELLILALGLWWSREYTVWRLMKPDLAFLRPFLGFSAAFFWANLLLTLFHQGGAPFVQFISGDYKEAGFYSIAFGAYLAGVQGVWKLLSAFGPLLTALRARGDWEALEGWVNRLLVVLGLGSVTAAAVLLAYGGWVVERVFGPGYEQVAALLPVLGVAGLFIGPSGVARLLAVACDLPKVSVVGAALQVGVFLAAGALVVPVMGSVGAAWVVTGAAALYAAFVTWRVRGVVGYRIRPWLTVMGVGVTLAPLVRLGWWGFPVFVGLYGGVLLGMGVVRRDELRPLWDGLRGGRPSPADSVTR
jgi:O-antigen/teichoic acid export membrane protein